MRLREIAALISLSRPPAPHGMRHLARCNSIDDLARIARRRLPAAVAGYLDGGAEDEYTLRRNRAAFDDVQLVPHVLRDVTISTIDLDPRLTGARADRVGADRRATADAPRRRTRGGRRCEPRWRSLHG